MPQALFSRVIDNTTWQSLSNSLQKQKERSCRPLQYKVLANVPLTTSQFDDLTKCISKPHPYYLQYSVQSVADKYGVWHCIVISAGTDGRNLVLYTAGRTFPLYAAII